MQSYSGVTIEKLRRSINEGDLVPFVKRGETEKDNVLLDARVIQKLPNMVKVSYMWNGAEVEEFETYAQILINHTGNGGAKKPVGNLSQMSFDSFFDAIMAPLNISEDRS